MMFIFGLLLIVQGSWTTIQAQNLSADPFEIDSTSNPFSQAGSPFGTHSINNPFSEVGSPFSQRSANNPFGNGVPLDTEIPMDKALGFDDKTLGLETRINPLEHYFRTTEKLSQDTQITLQTRLKEGELETERLASEFEQLLQGK